MPVFRAGQGHAPTWCELEQFDIVRLPAGGAHVFARAGKREKLIVAQGCCRIRVGQDVREGEPRTNLDLSTPDGQFAVIEALTEATVVRMAGRWGDVTGGSGVFNVLPVAQAQARGDPAGYEKETAFDNHYHDCDEYWIIVEGSGVAVSEGKTYNVGPGDCVATGMGQHHDFPRVGEPVLGVYFETTLEGEQRRGHLWNHRDGQARPRPERV